MCFSSSFFIRFGIVLGAALDSKIDPNRGGSLAIFELDFDLETCWPQDGRQDRPKRAQEPPRAAPDPPMGSF